MLDHPRISRCEVQFEYANGVRGHGPIKTLRIHIDGELTNEVAREVLAQAEDLGCRKYVHHIYIVGDAPDWPQLAADQASRSREFLSRFLPTLSD